MFASPTVNCAPRANESREPCGPPGCATRNASRFTPLMMLECWCACLAYLCAGGTWVPINYRNAIDGQCGIHELRRNPLAFLPRQLGEQVKALKSRVPALRHLVCIDSEYHGDPSLAQFIEQPVQSEPPDWADPRGNPNRLVGLVPHRRHHRASERGSSYERFLERFRGNGRSLLAVRRRTSRVSQHSPAFSCAGPVAFAMFGLGATNVVLPRFDAGAVLHSIELHRVTHIFLPPTAFMLCLPTRTCGGAISPASDAPCWPLRRCRPIDSKRECEIFGPCMCQCYGQTEVPMLMTWLDRETVAAAAAGDHPGSACEAAAKPRSVCVSQSWMMKEGSCHPINPERLSLAGRWLPPAITTCLRQRLKFAHLVGTIRAMSDTAMKTVTFTLWIARRT